MPDVIGLSSDEASNQLETAGFDVGYGLQDAPEPGVDHETVTGAYPSPGTLVPFGSPIWLEVYIDDQMDTASPI
ncbi:MAG: PASTA domain-containing protein, partial [Acidimicrobiaceae bacterium]|nr:PASTA domain-containing protein [Acidimicrobiaceae bacterium]